MQRVARAEDVPPNEVVRVLDEIDPATFELALRLARTMGRMRATSRMAVETFLAAAEADEIVAAAVTIRTSSKAPCEASVHVGVDVWKSPNGR